MSKADNTESPSLTTVGVLYPGNSEEKDYLVINKLLGPQVSLRVVHTELQSEEITLDILQKAGHEETLVDGALKLNEENLDSIMWACAGGSFSYGWQGAQQQAYGLYEVAAVPASNTSFAFVEALQHLGLRRVAVSAAYPDDLMEKLREFLGHAQIEVLAQVKSISTGAIIAGAVTQKSLFKLIDKVNQECPEAEAILLPETTLHVVEWLEEMEKYAGKPILAANQVTVWYGLKLAGQKQTYQKLGTLFAKGM